MSYLGLILDSYGGVRTIVAEAESMRSNVGSSEWLHVVPNLTVQEPIAWNDIPIVIERARLEFEKWLATRPNLSEEQHNAVTLYRLRKLELQQGSLNLTAICET